MHLAEARGSAALNASSFASSASPVLGALVTGVSANHFAEMRGLIISAQRFLPAGWPIVVYDLVSDLSREMERDMSSWCGVEVRRFKSERFGFTLDSRFLTVSMWKPFMIRQCLLSLPPLGILIYADASNRLQEPLGTPLLDAVRRIGYVGRETIGPVARYTHPRMAVELAKIGAVSSTDLRDYLDVPMVCGCLSFWSRTPTVLERFIRPWAACATRRECILPPGADGLDNRAGLSRRCRPGLEGHCHRNDQSALSMILHEAFRSRGSAEERASSGTSRGSVGGVGGAGGSSSSRRRFGGSSGRASSSSDGRALLPVPPYLRNTSMVGKETRHMGKAVLYGTVVTTERSSRHSAPPLSQGDALCGRSRAADFLASAGADASRSWAPCAWTNGCCTKQPATPSCRPIE